MKTYGRIVSISQSRFFSFQVIGRCSHLGRHYAVSISQSRFFSFQGECSLTTDKTGSFSFNLAIEVLFFSSCPTTTGIVPLNLVSISQSRFFSFQVGTAIADQTIAATVSISQSRFFSFQVAPFRLGGRRVKCRFNLAIEVLFFSSQC